MADCATCREEGAALTSLWGDEPDLRLCPSCGDWFLSWSARPRVPAVHARLDRAAALVMEELLSGTSRPAEALAQARSLVHAPALAALLVHLDDDALAPLLEPLVRQLPTATGDLAHALAWRLDRAAKSPRFTSALRALLDAAPPSPRVTKLLATCLAPARPPLARLSTDEVNDFWSLGVSLEARWVPDDEWARAVAEGRVQEVSSFSSMGTAETGWVRCSSVTASREQCAVVPPGQTAEDTPWGDMMDDRDTTAVCWQPFWDTQVAVAVSRVEGLRRRALLIECAERLVELEGSSPDADAPERQRALLGWLRATTRPPGDLASELTAITQRSLSHLRDGARARWLGFDCAAAVNAVLRSAERGPRDFWGHGDTAREAVVRMELLRFIVRLVRQ
jgi:hypothetical protein